MRNQTYAENKNPNHATTPIAETDAPANLIEILSNANYKTAGEARFLMFDEIKLRTLKISNGDIAHYFYEQINPPEFPERLFDRRLQSKLNINDFAVLVGIDLESYQTIESGSRSPKNVELTTISKKLGLSETYLLHGDHTIPASAPTSSSAIDDASSFATMLLEISTRVVLNKNFSDRDKGALITAHMNAMIAFLKGR